jgi:hypothetical protein
MTRKIYKSAMGKTVDLGALLLQNEQVRAVGNMGVNAAGDVIDSANKSIDRRNRQVQKQYNRQTNVSDISPASSNVSVRKDQDNQKQKKQKKQKQDVTVETIIQDSDDANDPIVPGGPAVSSPAAPGPGGLAAAIARSREIKQELEKTMRQRAQESSIRKI